LAVAQLTFHGPASGGFPVSVILADHEAMATIERYEQLRQEQPFERPQVHPSNSHVWYEGYGVAGAVSTALRAGMNALSSMINLMQSN